MCEGEGVGEGKDECEVRISVSVRRTLSYPLVPSALLTRTLIPEGDGVGRGALYEMYVS